MTSESLFQPRALLHDFLSFLKRPQVLEPKGPWTRKGLGDMLVLTATNIAVLLVLILPLMGLWQWLFALPSPDAFDALPDGWLFPVAVLIAPPAEELLFRGWQSGRPRIVPVLLAGLGLVVAIAVFKTVEVPLALRLGVLALLLIAGAAGWFALRKRTTPGWYRRVFPFVFYAVAVGFALVHLTNYSQATLLAVPLVLPQLWAGLLLGFARMRIGVIGAIAVHMASNAAALALATVGG